VATFDQQLARLKDDLITQGQRVLEMTLRAVESYFERDGSKASSVVNGDMLIDKADVEIERASIPLLAMGETDEHSIRSVLTIVKVNNELERIADLAVNIAEVAVDSGQTNEKVPSTFRVMANSVVGVLRDAIQALAKDDITLAERVLSFDDTVDRFKTELMLDAQQKVASGEFGVKFAFKLATVVRSLERIADHSTNICEQVIYLETGHVVRHLPQGWSKPAPPQF
jgi:phosphate transport system protein